MAAISIKLIFNLETGKKDIYIDFESEADALPIEHEQAHRAVVERLLGQRVIMEDELGNVFIQRVTSRDSAPIESANPVSSEPESISNPT